MEKLLAAGADMNIKNSKAWTALLSAAASGHFEVVLRLVQNGAAWRKQASDDVIKMITRKTNYKCAPTLHMYPHVPLGFLALSLMLPNFQGIWVTRSKASELLQLSLAVFVFCQQSWVIRK